MAFAPVRRTTVMVSVTMLLCALTLCAGYANKVRCVGPSFDALGRSEPDYAVRIARDVCYSDIQYLWIGRDIDRHVFPYVSGGYNPTTEQLYGGAVEYPVLTGLAIWLAAIPSSTDGQFLLFSAVLLALAGLLSAALLAWLAGLRSWWFALAPPLVLYAFHNWDLFAVCATVLACWALLRGSRGPTRPPAGRRAGADGDVRAVGMTANGRPDPTGSMGRPGPLGSMDRPDLTGSIGRPGPLGSMGGPDPTASIGRPGPLGSMGGPDPTASIGRPGPLVLAAVALGVGAAFKLYPMMFALPVALWLGAGGWRPRLGSTHPGRSRWLVALAFVAGTTGVFLLINLPFMIAGWAGWWASFQFQWSRPIDLTTNTIWFWGARPYSDSANTTVQHDLAVAATVSTLAALLLACVLGWLRFGRDRGYPWLPVCAAMVCGYLLFNKVHSPQFALWLLPFFVLLRVRAGWILAYFVADAAIGIGFFRWQFLINSGAPDSAYDALSPQLVLIGVWGRAALLVALFIVFLRAEGVAPPPLGDPGPPAPRSPRRRTKGSLPVSAAEPVAPIEASAS